MSQLDVGQLIWTSVKPLLTLLTPAFLGAVLARRGMLDQQALRGASMLSMTAFLPCLLFYNVVSTISTSNAHAIGPIALCVFAYQIMGAALALLVEMFVFVPPSFRSGYIAASAFSNWGQISLALIQSVTAGPPFQAGDTSLAVAYTSIWLFFSNLVFFAFGGVNLIQRDFKSPSTQALNTSVRQRVSRLRRRAHARQATDCIALEGQLPPADVSTTPTSPDAVLQLPLPSPSDTLRTPSLVPSTIGVASANTSRAPSIVAAMPAPSSGQTAKRRLRKLGLIAWQNLIYPPTSALLLALTITLVAPLRALFVNTDYKGIHPAPDGKPPLDVIMGVALFCGNASVPVGLVVLGAAVGTMKLPRRSELPLGAIMALVVCKLVIMPVVGVVIVRAMVSGGLIEQSNKPLQFLMSIQAAMPSATNQVTLALLYATQEVNNVDLLCAHLIIQYPVTAISITIVSALTLKSF